MFKTPQKLALAASVSILTLAAPLAAEEKAGLSELDVTTSYDAAQDGNAAEMLPNIAEDLRKAIAERIPGSDDAADPVMRVDVQRVALNGDTILPASAEFNELTGVVAIETNTGEGGLTVPINVVATTDLSAVPEGYVGIAPSLDDFYNAMITGFAENVEIAYQEQNKAGARISK